MKAIPWVRKCVLRLSWLSKPLPQTLHSNFPSDPSAPAPEFPFPPPWEALPESSGSAAPFFFLWEMKRWRLREIWEVKQRPHSRHCWEFPSVRCCGMWAWNSARLPARNPHLRQRNGALPPDLGFLEGGVVLSGSSLQESSEESFRLRPDTWEREIWEF